MNQASILLLFLKKMKDVTEGNVDISIKLIESL